MAKKYKKRVKQIEPEDIFEREPIDIDEDDDYGSDDETLNNGQITRDRLHTYLYDQVSAYLNEESSLEKSRLLSEIKELVAILDFLKKT